MYQKLIVLSLSLWLLCSSTALADWNPTFDPNKHVYIDPALQQHPSAPIGFESELTKQVAEFKGTNYYVVAIESGQNPNGSIGVAKADDITAAWTGLKDFPVDDYALVVWARRRSDPSKGGFGKNVSANLVWAKALDIKPIFKPFMPQNPRGALVAIVGGIQSSIDSANAALWLGKILAAGMFMCFIGWVLQVSGLSKMFEDLRTRKDRATEQLLKFKLAANSVSERLLEIDSMKILPFYTKIYPDNEELKVANKNHLHLAALCVKLNTIVAVAQSLLDTGNHQDILDLFTSPHRLDLTGNEQGTYSTTIKFNNVQELLRSIEARIDTLKNQIFRIEAAKGNVQAPPKPAPWTAPPRQTPAPTTPPRPPANTPPKTSPARTATPPSTTIYNDYSTRTTVNRSSDSSNRSSTSSSRANDKENDPWKSDGGDYGRSDNNDGGDYSDNSSDGGDY